MSEGPAINGSGIDDQTASVLRFARALEFFHRANARRKTRQAKKCIPDRLVMIDDGKYLRLPFTGHASEIIRWPKNSNYPRYKARKYESSN